ncbi:helix-turn-helix transcriptional regulator [Mesorhizobium amorphae]|uniref:helix-turn-helix transcriptional regulator n=1 Tax=Mesorhizobium amorphae TaxID=71433 RepID=UPI00058B9B2A|nr:AlpA family transcriptional regulator [Mesorhizobium amorphae]ANT53517.1 transcriptional regulator [Mesorhizobium amorphae CCNWGS0123]GLR41447.1 AlpA family phage regulatory protein [Mesorhizobium amorphae]
MTTFIRRPEVLTRTGLSVSTLYELIKAGRFPKPLKIGLTAVAWDADEIQRWQERKIAERDTAAA